MKGYKSRALKSKWVKTKWLLQQQELRKYVPQTMQFNKQNLSAMVSDYATVFFKPTGGSGGNRIIRINRKKTGYQTQYNTTKTSLPTLDRLYSKLNRFSGGRSFLLQKGIHLAKTNGRPFDIRIMVQKTNEGKWVSTAVFTKIGKAGKVATNYNQGGKIGYFSNTLAGAGYTKDAIQTIESKLEQLGVAVGENFDLQQKGFRELGLDVALDSKGDPWILEVNTRPQFYPLKKMKNLAMYKRIISYAKQYGRKK